MLKYNNHKTFLESIGFELKTSFDEFKNNEISFRCTKDHVTNLKVTSFMNKKCKYKDDYSLLCTICTSENNDKHNFEVYSEKIFAKNGHLLLTLDSSTRKCSYECGNCGNITYTSIQNLLKYSATEYCSKCINIKNRVDIDSVNDILKKFNYTCLEYNNNKDLKVECDKKHTTSTLSLFDYKRGRRCPVCAVVKRKETLIEKYGTDQLFSSEYFKNKRIETCLTKYGYPYAMQNEEIFSKAQKSMFSLKPFTFPSGNVVMVQGYEPYCLFDLINLYAEEEENIIVNSTLMPKFFYNFKDKECRYYPDIMIQYPDKPKFIEVKSIYTYNLDLDKNIAKWNCVLENNYDIEIWIYDKDGTLIEIKKHILKCIQPGIPI